MSESEPDRYNNDYDPDAHMRNDGFADYLYGSLVFIGLCAVVALIWKALGLPEPPKPWY